MPLTKPEELLEALMRGHQLTPVELDAFLLANPAEGQLYDYKGGELTDKPNREDGKKTTREYVTGFANAEGGVLIIGPADKPPHKITGCQTIGNQAVADWAKDNLLDVAGMFSPAPRFCTVKHPDGDVLLIATERAPQLIPVIDSRKIRYHLRIGTSTVHVPEYLISDLVLGRRKQPVFELRLTSVEWEITYDQYLEDRQRLLNIELSFMLENRSLVRAQHVEVGVVGWTLSGPPVPVNDHILTYIELGETQSGANRHTWFPMAIACRNHPHELNVVAPFERREIKGVKGITLPGSLEGFYRCAVYVMPEGGPPKWYTLESDTNGDWVMQNISFKPDHTKLEAVPYGDRPQICYLEGADARAMLPK